VEARAGTAHVRLSTMEAYEKALEAVPREVSFGHETIRVFRGPELGPLQVGYSIGPTGESLAGDRDGNWLEKWLVIGYEELCGDPIFIDALAEGFPVYTAMQGEGRWDSKRIAVSLETFGQALSAIGRIAKGRENPVALEGKPITRSEKEETIDVIRRENPGIDLEFWEVLLS
jgi:hypothetical protein